jgi:coenzyme F420-reducing hydrogenase gamma subunit
VNTAARQKRLGVFKFASCDGCQLSLLSCEDELLNVAAKVDIAYFLEASSKIDEGPYDIALVEGSISTDADFERLRSIRERSEVLVTIGACATSGGIQALRNWADHDEFSRYVYPHPEYLRSLSTSTAISEHTDVDYELRGCPINRFQLLEVLSALVAGRRPVLPSHSVCVECKRRGTVCLAVTRDEPCIGPITQAGCGAICPAYDRPCYGCFGPARQPNGPSLAEHYLRRGVDRKTIVHQLRNVNAAAPLFQIESNRLEKAAADTPGDGADHD